MIFIFLFIFRKLKKSKQETVDLQKVFIYFSDM